MSAQSTIYKLATNVKKIFVFSTSIKLDNIHYVTMEHVKRTIKRIRGNLKKTKGNIVLKNAYKGFYCAASVSFTCWLLQVCSIGNCKSSRNVKSVQKTHINVTEKHLVAKIEASNSQYQT